MNGIERQKLLWSKELKHMKNLDSKNINGV